MRLENLEKEELIDYLLEEDKEERAYFVSSRPELAIMYSTLYGGDPKKTATKDDIITGIKARIKYIRENDEFRWMK